MVMVVPRFGTLSMKMWPSWSSTIHFTTANPSPVSYTHLTLPTN